ncbi:MAG: recombination protein NinG [Bacteroidales bacterium]|nr:recombination protein NinG [Bacteroidales bacterium]
METPTWQKTEMICACTKPFRPQYRNGILVSKSCPNCRLKSLHKPTGVRLASELPISRNKPEKRKKTPRQCAMDRADEWFSRYIRLKYSFESGGELFCKCYTCGNPKPILVIENGHFQRRGYKTTRFHPNDARPQCTFCNHHRSGEPEKFELNLIRDIGQDKVNELKKLAQQIGEDNEPFYREQAAKYRKLFNMLLKERKLKSPWK